MSTKNGLQRPASSFGGCDFCVSRCWAFLGSGSRPRLAALLRLATLFFLFGPTNSLCGTTLRGFEERLPATGSKHGNGGGGGFVFHTEVTTVRAFLPRQASEE